MPIFLFSGSFIMVVYMPIVKFENVSKIYTSGDHELYALNQVSFSLDEGKFVVILGPSGAGKSTLLNLLGGLDSPSEGTITVAGADISKLSDNELADYRASLVGFVFQFYNLMHNLTALENAAYPLYLRGLPKKEAEAQAAERLEQVGITADKRNRLPSHLSGGEQQRIAIARALADEPTGNLDSENGMRIIELLSELAHEENRCVIVVTHDPKVADQADEILQMEDGRLSLPSVVIEES